MAWIHREQSSNMSSWVIAPYKIICSRGSSSLSGLLNSILQFFKIMNKNLNILWDKLLANDNNKDNEI